MGAVIPSNSGAPCSEPGYRDRGSFYQPIAQTALSSKPGLTPRQREAAAYESNCIYCHAADPGKLKTPPDAVGPAAFRQDPRAWLQPLGRRHAGPGCIPEGAALMRALLMSLVALAMVVLLPTTAGAGEALRPAPFSVHDLNRDGYLSREEYAALRAKCT